MDLIKYLNWRYATKRMNGAKVPNEKVERILDAINLSASSIGLQPYTVFVIEDENLRKQIKPIANDQPQITECSHLLVFAAWDNLTEQRIDDFLNRMQEIRGSLPAKMKDWEMYLKNKAKNSSAEDNFNWNARQAYIGLGTALIAAATEQVDATPMEGFDSKALDVLLKLPEKGLRSVLIMPLGYRDVVTDYLVNLPKVRREKEKMFVRL
jgi:nitroreductase